MSWLCSWNSGSSLLTRGEVRKGGIREVNMASMVSQLLVPRPRTSSSSLMVTNHDQQEVGSQRQLHETHFIFSGNRFAVWENQCRMSLLEWYIPLP